MLSTMDFRTASQTPLRDSCNDGNKNFFPDLSIAFSTKYFETALNMDKGESFSLLKSIEVIVKKVADSSGL